MGEIKSFIKNPNAWGVKHYEKWKGKLSGSERLGMHEYLGAGYTKINSVLRESKGTKINDDIKAVDSALNKTKPPGTPHEILVRRGLDSGGGKHIDLSTLRAGSVFIDHGFMSTTASGAVGGAFKGDVEFQITVPKGARGAYITQSLAVVQGESEFLLPRGSKLKIGKVTKTGSRHVVEATVIEDTE